MQHKLTSLKKWVRSTFLFYNQTEKRRRNKEKLDLLILAFMRIVLEKNKHGFRFFYFNSAFVLNNGETI